MAVPADLKIFTFHMVISFLFLVMMYSLVIAYQSLIHFSCVYIHLSMISICVICFSAPACMVVKINTVWYNRIEILI